MCWYWSKWVKVGVYAKVDGAENWGVVQGIGAGFSIGVGDEVKNGVDNEFGEGVDLIIGSKVVSRKISRNKST